MREAAVLGACDAVFALERGEVSVIEYVDACFRGLKASRELDNQSAVVV